MQKRFRLCLKLARQNPSVLAKTVIYSVFGSWILGTGWNLRLKLDNFSSSWPESRFLLVLAETGSNVYFRLFKIRHICWQLGYFQSSWKTGCVAFNKKIPSWSRAYMEYVYMMFRDLIKLRDSKGLRALYRSANHCSMDIDGSVFMTFRKVTSI